MSRSREQVLLGWAVIATAAVLVLVVVATRTNEDLRQTEFDSQHLQERLSSAQGEAKDLGDLNRVCRDAIREAQEFAEGAVEYTDSVYDGAYNWVQHAFALGARGDLDELENGLARTIYEDQLFFKGQYAAEIRWNDWLGWSGGPLSVRNEAEECLGNL